jgi:outer membrane protein OmpA-like peptidoglycan-associated protein
MTVPDPSQPSGERDLAHTLIQRLRATLTDDPRPLRVIARTASPAGGGPPGPFVGDARRPEAGEPAGAMTLAEQLAAQRAALHRGSDRVALVVLTRWARLDEATVVAARRLHNALGPRLCSYWIGVGERRACPRTLVADHCGFARTGTAIADGPGLFRFSRQAFFGPQRDRDGDGVVDVEDRCAGTEAGTRVDWDGCSWRARRPQRPATEAGTRRRLAVIHFETDSAALDGADQGILDRLCRRARRAPDARYVIRGHTDARHRRDYNQDLGRQRAQAVADYLASCLSRPPVLRSFGESRPQASNATPAGRARNRRVEIWQRPGEARR